MPYDAVLDYHPEFEGFNMHDVVDIADVVLLGYPLMVAMNTSTKSNDLIIYEKVSCVL